jgi:hypothetical protein
MTVIEDKILRNFDCCLIKSILILSIFIFFVKFDKNLEKKVAKFLRNGFLGSVKIKQNPNWKNVSKTRTKPKSDDFLNLEQNPNPNQTQKNWNSRNINLNFHFSNRLFESVIWRLFHIYKLLMNWSILSFNYSI